MRKCKNEDKKKVLSYLKANSSMNGFFIGDVENFSLDDDFMDLWMQEENGRISSVLLRYFDSYLISSGRRDDFQEMARIITEDSRCERISGIDESMERIGELIKLTSVRRMSLASLTAETYNDQDPGLIPRRAGTDDLDDLFSFLMTVEEFDINEKSRSSFGKGIETGTGRAYFIRKEERIVACAQITAENSCNGTIVGVATDPAWRNRGFARACVSFSCRDMISDGKEVLLFYDNPDAGRLYRKLGFRDIGRWTMAKL